MLLRSAKPDVKYVEGDVTAREKASVALHLLLRDKIREKLIGESDAKELGDSDLDTMRARVLNTTYQVLAHEGLALPAKQRDRLVLDVIDEVTGFGPIQSLLDDETITDIMVNGADKIYAERDGKIFLTDRFFRDNRHIMQVIEKIVTPLGRKIDESSPTVDARLPDGSRVNAIIPPLAIKGPTLTIRKFSAIPLKIEDLVKFGSLSANMAEFLKVCVLGKLNIIVSGGGASGKTTTLNILSSFVPARERIITVEDAAELQLQQAHVVSLESRPPNLEGSGEITIRMLLRNALRMRPDRVVVGEVRGAESLDMLSAMNTGEGTMSTLHSNSPRDSLSRLETMTLMAGTDLPSRAIREQISTGVHLIVHQSRMRDGTRKITHITEIYGMRGEHVRLRDIFVYNQHGVDPEGKVLGEHRATGLRPKILIKLTQRGLHLTEDLSKELGNVRKVGRGLGKKKSEPKSPRIPKRRQV